MLVFVLDLHSQSRRAESYYKDTTTEFYGYKIKFSRIFADNEMLRFSVTIANPGDQFIIIYPTEIIASIPSTGYKTVASTHRKVMIVEYLRNTIVVPPHYSKRFTLHFMGDFRNASPLIDITKIHITEKLETVYSLPDIAFQTQYSSAAGPLKWMLVNYGDKNPQDDFRIIGTLTYSGNKFLGIMNNNIVLTTSDGKKFKNVPKANGTFHYDRSRTEKNQKYFFEIKSGQVKPGAVLSFMEAFGEYSLATMIGFQIPFVLGTEKDYEIKGEPEPELFELGQ